jgi:hypothetical protein
MRFFQNFSRFYQKCLNLTFLSASKYFEFIIPTLSCLGLLSKTKQLSVQFEFKEEGEEHNREARMIRDLAVLKLLS